MALSAGTGKQLNGRSGALMEQKSIPAASFISTG
ncbi:hypothetical protein EPYR_02798 [Erwinia pyrifoliae DSM 12163]|nr:hypothetical protein EPYR_02798 [Erwinia pyrifoliae DSM 12163]